MNIRSIPAIMSAFMTRATATRPAVWVGHISLDTNRFDESHAFFRQIGMRPIFKGNGVAVLELRGGTHIVLQDKQHFTPKMAPFDLMVDDLQGFHQELSSQGWKPSDIQVGHIHSSFTVQEPAGNTITINSSHVVGAV